MHESRPEPTVRSRTEAAVCPVGPDGRNRLSRYLLAAAGVVCVTVGAIGVVVPGLPTTIFLIAASYLFARSCPALERRLLRTRWFAPYMRFVDGQEEMPPQLRRRIIAIIWLSISISLSILLARDALAPGLALAIVAAGACGSWYVGFVAGRRSPAS